MHKLSFSLVVVILTSIVGFGWGLDQLFEQYTTNESPSDALFAYRLIGKNLAETLDQIENTDNFIQHWQQQNSINASLQGIDTFPLPKDLVAKFKKGEPLALASVSDLSLHIYMPLKQQVLSLTVPPIIQTSTEHIRLSFTLFFYIGILSLVLLWLYPLIKRLLMLSETAKAFGNGDLNQRINKSSSSYISGIEHEFNRMADRIESLIRDNKLLGNAVSHDLRTPLARLRFGIDSLSETDDIDTRKIYQQRMSNDITEMESLVQILLNYARLDQAMIEIEKQAINLSELLTACIDSAQINHKNLQIKTIDADCHISGDERYLTLLINNLLGNAIQYSKQKIVISLFSDKKHSCLIFEDDGPGIAEHQKEQILKPFVRGENTNNSKGYGMGLAIVSRIAEWHRASLHIERSIDYGGAKIFISFPAI